MIVDSEGRLPDTAKMLGLPGPLLVAVVGDRVGELPPAPEVFASQSREGRVDLEALLRELARRECSEVLVEAGAELAGAFIAAGLADRLVIYMAARLLGSTARPLVALPLESMAGAVDVKIVDMRALGGDWRITAEVVDD